MQLLTNYAIIAFYKSQGYTPKKFYFVVNYFVLFS